MGRRSSGTSGQSEAHIWRVTCWWRRLTAVIAAEPRMATTVMLNRLPSPSWLPSARKVLRRAPAVCQKSASWLSSR